MLSRKRQHLQAAFAKQIQPLVCMEAGWIPAAVELVVFLPLPEGHSEVRPRFRFQSGNRINPPMNANAVFDVVKTIVCLRGSPVIIGHRNLFDITLHAFIVAIGHRQTMLACPFAIVLKCPAREGSPCGEKKRAAIHLRMPVRCVGRQHGWVFR